MAVETKVQASTAAAAVSGLALWFLGHYVFKAGVPDVVASWVYVIVPGLVAFAAGYLAPHTPRPAAPAPAITMPGTISGAEAAEIKRQLAAAMGTPSRTAAPPAPDDPGPGGTGPA